MEKKFGFSKHERLCRRGVIDRVFAQGDSFFAYPLRCVYLEQTVVVESDVVDAAAVVADAEAVGVADCAGVATMLTVDENCNAKTNVRGAAKQIGNLCQKNKADSSENSHDQNGCNLNDNRSTIDASVNKAIRLKITSDDQVQVLFSVAKRYHKRAVKRNLIKRRLREAYRLNKQLLYAALSSQQVKNVQDRSEMGKRLPLLLEKSSDRVVCADALSVDVPGVGMSGVAGSSDARLIEEQIDTLSSDARLVEKQAVALSSDACLSNTCSSNTGSSETSPSENRSSEVCSSDTPSLGALVSSTLSSTRHPVASPETVSCPSRKTYKKIYICFVYTSKVVEPYSVVENGIKKALKTLRYKHLQGVDSSAGMADKVL